MTSSFINNFWPVDKKQRRIHAWRQMFLLLKAKGYYPLLDKLHGSLLVRLMQIYHLDQAN